MTPIRFSNLKYFAQSPAHYKYWLDHARPETKSLRFGDALDALLFQTKPVLTFDGGARRGVKWDAFEAANPGATILIPKEAEPVNGMLAAIKAHKPNPGEPSAMELLTGETQQKLSWTMGGRACQGTPDVFTAKRVVELKSGRTVHPDWFLYDACKYGYHAQLAWYANALQILKLVEPNPECYIVAVESSPPFPVTIFKLSDKAILEGTKLWKLWFERLLVCEASNAWPEYTSAVVPFDLPDSEGITLQIGGEEVEVE
jgi:hypothetical protein